MHPADAADLRRFGEMLAPQNGAPLRITIPWKYGFKGGKSIVKIRFVEKRSRAPPGSRPAPANTASTQRQPNRRSPALEPGKPAAPRRIQQTQDADVQRLWRSGGVAVYQHGFEEVLLTVGPLAWQLGITVAPTGSALRRGDGIPPSVSPLAPPPSPTVAHAVLPVVIGNIPDVCKWAAGCWKGT